MEKRYFIQVNDNDGNLMFAVRDDGIMIYGIRYDAEVTKEIYDQNFGKRCSCGRNTSGR